MQNQVLCLLVAGKVVQVVEGWNQEPMEPVGGMKELSQFLDWYHQVLKKAFMKM